MLNEDFSAKIVGMQDVEIENFYEKEERLHVHCKIKRKKNKCPCCGKETDKVHDYREQTIKDAPIFWKVFLIHLKRIFDVISYSIEKLPKTLSIDEFKGNTGGEKYQCILAVPENKLILDILPKRYEYYLSHCFNSFSRESRDNVEYFVSDMWKTFSDTASTWLKNATKIVDKYHWIRQIIWAFEAVKKSAYFYKERFLKILDCNAYGYRNFNLFRNRILHIFSNQNQPFDFLVLIVIKDLETKNANIKENKFHLIFYANASRYCLVRVTGLEPARCCH